MNRIWLYGAFVLTCDLGKLLSSLRQAFSLTMAIRFLLQLEKRYKTCHSYK